MNPQTRKLLVQRLIPAIGVIGPDFEMFGGLVLDHVLSTPLEHTGLNGLGFPVSRVLDSSSADGKVVAEYSAQADYFTAGMDKAKADVAHALERRPNAELILLLASQPDRPQVIDDFLKSILMTPEMKGRAVKVWGAEKIAEHLVDKVVFNDAAIEALSAYLPLLTEIWEESARDRLFPAPSPTHCPRPAVSDEISRRLTTRSSVILAGIAGCGKSDAAAAFGADNRDAYDLRIWLDRDDIAHVDDLHGTPLMRGREKRNIASLMRTRRCLLVIDDPKGAFDISELAALCGPGSHVLLTVRELGADIYLLPELSPVEARTILNSAVAQSCPDVVFETIWSTVGGHPLSLALMNGAVRGGAPWSDIVLDCETVGRLPDRTQRLADRLLARHRAVLQPDLAVFEWAGQSDCDAGFLRHAIQPLGVRNLASHALTAADRDAVVRLHDVVFSSLGSLDWWSPAEHAQLDDKLAAYLETASEANDLSFWAAAGSFRKRLATLVERGDLRPAYLLALLTVVNPEDVDPAPLGDPVAKAAALAARGEPISIIEFRLLIESFERLYLRAKAVGQNEADVFADAGLPLFDSLAALPGLTNRQVAEIAHHRGKALAWLKRSDEARREYEAVMSGPSPLDATRLQLVRAYKSTRAFAEAAKLGDQVLMSAEQTGAVAPSVLLAVIQDIPWQDSEVRSQLLWPRQAFIEETIVGFANAGYDQAYKALSSVARYWSREAPDVLRRVMEAIPVPSADRLEDDEARFHFGDILFEFSRAIETDVAATQALALSFYEAEVSPQPFHLQRHAELLIDMGRPVEAETMLRVRDDLATSCWAQRLMAHARADQNDPTEALSWIDKALSDKKGASRYFEFRELRYRIRRALGAPDALDDLREALRLAPEGPQRDRLRARVKSAEAEG